MNPVKDVELIWNLYQDFLVIFCLDYYENPRYDFQVILMSYYLGA